MIDYIDTCHNKPLGHKRKRYAFANEGAAANHQNGAKSLAEHSFHLAPLIL
jgi:hypothetical protein